MYGKMLVLYCICINGPALCSHQIAMISPGLNSCEHTVNTLRYADRCVCVCTTCMVVIIVQYI